MESKSIIIKMTKQFVGRFNRKFVWQETYQMGQEILKTDRIMEIINSEEHRKNDEEKHPVSHRI